MIDRRSFMSSVGAFLAAPAIVRVASLMPISVQAPAIIHPAGFEVVNPKIASLWFRHLLEMDRAYFAAMNRFEEAKTENKRLKIHIPQEWLK